MTKELEPVPEGELWKVDSSHNLTDALGLLKDWVTTLLSLQTTIIAAVAAFVGFHGPGDFVQMHYYEAVPLWAAVGFSVSSIFGGTFLLNMLPAAAQRVPTEHMKIQADLFSITTKQGGWSILFWTRWFRFSFLFALGALLLFVAAKVIPPLLKSGI